MNDLKEKYWDKFIQSKLKNIPNDFPMNLELVQTNRKFVSYVNKILELYEQYVQLKIIYEDDPGGLLKTVVNKLKNIKDEREEDYIETYEIIKNFYYKLDYPNLSDDLKSKFDQGIKILEKTINYFCSYTTKGLPEINSSYEQVLVNVFGIDKTKQYREWREKNYLAKLVVRYLNEHGFNSYFFDEDKIVNGEVIQDKVFEYCERTAVLVVIAQQETFRDKANEVNWCFKEYERYNNAHQAEKQFIVYKTPNLAKPVGARPSYQKYYEFITTPQGIKSTTIEIGFTNEIIKNFVDGDAQIILDANEKIFLRYDSQL